ncbi:MAG TPA: hypothetical protein V6D05_14490 [Stenomitos sp.]
MQALDVFPKATRTPWPQANPRYPQGMPPAVREIPWDEQVDFSVHLLARYHLTERLFQPFAHLQAMAYPGLAEVSDETFAELFSERLFSKFLNSTLDEGDRARFQAYRYYPGTLYKVDFTPMASMERLGGMYAAATTTLFGQNGDGRLHPLAIQLDGLLLEPSDGHAWELAKYFVLNGAACLTITGVHALLHFPMDSVNALTKSLLPSGHLLARLLMPHLRFSLMLDRTVLEHPRTLLDNDQRECYTPFAGTAAGVRGLIRDAYQGLPGNSSYPAYRFPRRPPELPSAFGAQLQDYYACMLEFVRPVVAHLQAGDPGVTTWAHELSQWLPGFPDGAEIWEGDTLAETVASILCDVTVMHAADHYDLSRIPLDVLPLRLRLPPPTTKEHPPFDRRALTTHDDRFRHAMAHELFVRPHPLTRLATVDYRFDDPELYRLNCQFLADLADVDARWSGRGLIPLDQIPCSIQY